MTPRPLSFAPGPTEIHPAARAELRALADEGYASESHRSAPVRREVERLADALTALLRIPEGHRILLVGSATEAMERIVDGAARSRSFHLVNGAFARRFREVARAAGLQVEDAEVPDGASFRVSVGEGPTALPAGTELLALTQKGVSREDAYRLVQRNAMKVWEAGADFRSELKADAEVRAALSGPEIDDMFDLGHHMRHVDTIFARVFGSTDA